MYEKHKDVQLDILFDAVLCLKSREECYKFFDDLCTAQELRALTQRMMVAKMLDRNCVYNEIVSETGASTATISRVNRSLLYGSDGYRLVIDRLGSAGE